MDLINTIFGVPLGYIMYGAYSLVGNYGVSIVLFALVTKILMFPLSLVAQKNSIAMVRIKPLLDDIRRRYGGNSDEIIRRQKELCKEARYSTWKGILPLLMQIPIILGLINVVYNPLQHLLHLDPVTISAMLEQAAQLLGVRASEMGAGAQLAALRLAQANPGAFSSVVDTARIAAMNLKFLGLNMAEVPTLTSWTMIYPVLSGLSALALALYQDKHNILQQGQSAVGRWSMTAVLVAFSAFFAYVLPCALGLYWTVGNLLSIPVLWLSNKIYDPSEYIDRARLAKKPKLSKEEKRAQRELAKRQRATQRADRKRFARTGKKELVFYSESSGFYKYFKGFIEYLLDHSDVTIHYVTSDIDDQVFALGNPRIQTYYIGPVALIRFMMVMDADLVVMTMPDLEKYHIKRSLVRRDIEYLYLDHGMTSFHLMLQEGALDHYDTIFCYGPNHICEVRETEKAYQLPPKRLVKTGFPLLDSMIEGARAAESVENDPKVILVAPSWQPDNLLEYCLDQTLRPLVETGYRIVLRPHPEFVKRFPDKMRAIIDTYGGEGAANFEVQTSFASNDTVYTADLIITDWSSIANEFSYATKKPSLFINTPMKVMNPNYTKIASVPLDISLRDRIGVSLDVDQLDALPTVVEDLFTQREHYSEQIARIVEENIFDVGDGARAGGEYIIRSLEHRRRTREAAASGAPLPQGEIFGSGVDDGHSDDTLLERLTERMTRLADTRSIYSSEARKVLDAPLLADDAGDEPRTQGEWLLDLLERLSEETEVEHEQNG